MTDEPTGAAERAAPGRILRALQETAKADLPDFGGPKALENPLEHELADGTGSSNGTARPEAPVGEPTLEIERDGDHVSRITAVCGCGRKIDIHCDYDAAKPEPDADDGGET